MYFDTINTNIKLKKPLKINFSNEMIKRILNRYNQSREKGGFISGKIKHIEGQTVIEMEKLFPIANTSPNPRWTYIPRFSQYNNTLTRIKQKFPQYIPFFYHNHPKTSLFDLLGYQNLKWEKIYEAVINQSPSNVDSQSSQILSAQMGDFLIPHLLITKNLQGDFLLFVFGPGTDYEDVSFPTIGKWTEQKMDWTIDQIKEKFFPWIQDQWSGGIQDKLKLVTYGIISSLFITGAIALAPSLSISIVMAIFLEYLNYDSLQQVDNPIIIRTGSQRGACITIKE